MNWIQQNPARMMLAVTAAGVALSTVLLWQRVDRFGGEFRRGEGVSLALGIDAPEPRALNQALASVNHASTWPAGPGTASLFVGKARVRAGAEGRIRTVEEGSFSPPIPNRWFTQFGLNPAAPGIAEEDTDGDGFTNQVEFAGMDGRAHLAMDGAPVLDASGRRLADDSTSPVDAASHPPYHLLLSVAPGGLHARPFRMKFMAAQPSAGKGDVEKYQINLLDGGGSQFVPLGGKIPGTRYRVTNFLKKERTTANGVTEDCSELTVENTESGEKVVLPRLLVVNSPDLTVTLHYGWVARGGAAPADMNKKRGDIFFLPPEKDNSYKVVDIQAPNPQNGATGGVTILLPNGAHLQLRAMGSSNR